MKSVKNNNLKQHVPMTISITFLTVYLLISAFLFNSLEKWSLIQSAYFSYVTIATIGFGDLSPQLSIISACVYIMFGLAVLSMVFNLVEKEILSNFRWLSKKINIKINNNNKSKTKTNKNIKKILIYSNKRNKQ